MLIPILAAALASPPAAPPRIERLMALARLDAAVHYFHPAVATRASAWDSLFAAHAIRIADAPSRGEYGRLVRELLRESNTDVRPAGSPQRALVYEGFPTALMQGSGGYRIRWRPAGSEAHRVDMGEGVRVDLLLSEPGDDTTSAIPAPAPPPSAEWREGYPAPGYRVLAAARIWSTIRLFFPYKSLMDGRWDDQLRAALPEFERARDALEYAQAAARFTAQIHDTHVSVTSMPLSTWIGAVPVGAAARLVEDQLVITRLVDSSAARAGLRVGDVVTSIDGEPVARRIARLTPFLAASTPQSLRFRLGRALLRGPDGRLARLEVRGADGEERSLLVPRSLAFNPAFRAQRAGNIIRILPGNIGYVDLDRLPLSMVDSAFRVLAGTSAIILDDRGYPNGTAWAIAPRLNTHPEPTGAAAFRRLIVPSPDTTRTTVFGFTQPIPPAMGRTKYTGRTVLLIDERTISQAEHTGLFFEAANGTTFIGSPTTGANGDVTMLPLPGGIAVSFTGHDVRHADGRQLQRVGLTPEVLVMPTIAGIRAGRDEVLEAAVRFLGGPGEIPPDTGNPEVARR
jgi:C-terminal processing protease CtpA/Prc